MFSKVAAFILFVFIFTAEDLAKAESLDLNIENFKTEDEIFLNQTSQLLITSDAASKIRVQRIVVVPEMYWPVDDNEITSGFGYRTAPCKQCSADHQGIDFAKKIGTPVYSAMDGIISKIEYAGEYGLHIYIEHIATINTKNERWETVYAHLNPNSIPLNISVGSLVKGGTQIAEIGNTGLSTGPHLHFELRIEGEKVDPEKYLLMYTQ